MLCLSFVGPECNAQCHEILICLCGDATPGGALKDIGQTFLPHIVSKVVEKRQKKEQSLTGRVHLHKLF